MKLKWNNMRFSNPPMDDVVYDLFTSKGRRLQGKTDSGSSSYTLYLLHDDVLLNDEKITHWIYLPAPGEENKPEYNI